MLFDCHASVSLVCTTGTPNAMMHTQARVACRWNSGFGEARVACRSMGMKPVREGGIIPDDQWDEPWVGETADVKEMADDHEQD
jgi:hypothetical protein